MSSTIQLLSYNQVAEILGVSRSTIIRRVKAGTMPAPIRLDSQRRVAFIASEIEEWLRSRERVTYGRDQAA